MGNPFDYSGLGRTTGLHSSQIRHFNLNEQQLPVRRHPKEDHRHSEGSIGLSVGIQTPVLLQSGPAILPCQYLPNNHQDPLTPPFSLSQLWQFVTVHLFAVSPSPFSGTPISRSALWIKSLSAQRLESCKLLCYERNHGLRRRSLQGRAKVCDIEICANMIKTTK